jgi:hypothetical protein
VVEVVVDLKTTLDQEVLVRVELVVVDKEVIQVALLQLEELTLVVEVELVEVLALILKQVNKVGQVLLFLEDQVQLHLLLVQDHLQQCQLTLVVIN